jgi:hypothetical protein
LEDSGSKTVEASRMTFKQLADFYEAHYVLPLNTSAGAK